MEYTHVFIQVAILVVFAAIFSGLNISLMSLSVTDLKRKSRLGNMMARRVLPLRQNAHLSLAAILFANVAVVSTSSLVLEHHFNGWIAGIATTILMVIFGEVIPQAIFVRSALRFTSFFAPLIKLMTWVTYPLSKPIQLALDRWVGEEPRLLHSRQELGLIIGEHQTVEGSELDEDEVEIIKSALQLSEKTVGEIMQPIKDVYWLPLDATLDAKTVDDITAHGYSRIPVLSRDKRECYGVLLMKDMVDIDFDGNPIPVTSFKLHHTKMVGSRTALDTMFRRFISLRSHLVPVEKDDEIIGIVTIEDLIEEILGHEIADETDHAHHRE
jgi:metal transporter CNNM